jgi:hypothetical protein
MGWSGTGPWPGACRPTTRSRQWSGFLTVRTARAGPVAADRSAKPSLRQPTGDASAVMNSGGDASNTKAHCGDNGGQRPGRGCRPRQRSRAWRSPGTCRRRSLCWRWRRSIRPGGLDRVRVPLRCRRVAAAVPGLLCGALGADPERPGVVQATVQPPHDADRLGLPPRRSAGAPQAAHRRRRNPPRRTARTPHVRRRPPPLAHQQAAPARRPPHNLSQPGRSDGSTAVVRRAGRTVITSSTGRTRSARRPSNLAIHGGSSATATDTTINAKE